MQSYPPRELDSVRQVASDILRRGVELRYCKLFPQLKFLFQFQCKLQVPLKTMDF